MDFDHDRDNLKLDSQSPKLLKSYSYHAYGIKTVVIGMYCYYYNTNMYTVLHITIISISYSSKSCSAAAA